MGFATCPDMASHFGQPDYYIEGARARELSGPPIVTTEDRRRLGSLLLDADYTTDPLALQDLEDRLDEALYVEREDVPDTVVTMNSTVKLHTEGKMRWLTLVYPDEEEFYDDSVSVLDPLGIVLLGASAGDVIEYLPGRGTARIRRIVHQPEQVLAATERGVGA